MNRAVTAACFFIAVIFSVGLTTGVMQTNNRITGQEYEKGYQQGLKDGAGTGYIIRDPSYTEMLAFLSNDQTNLHTYVEDGYTCFEYTRDVRRSAFEFKIRVGYVWLYFPNDRTHALVCFNTTDRGLVYIEPQSDDEVFLAVGKPYWDRTKFAAPPYNDTVIKWDIIW